MLLDDDFQFTAQSLLDATDSHTKVIWICSPNNPTGNALNRSEIIRTLETFRGIVVIDKNDQITYIEYVPEVASEPNYDNALNAVKSAL